MTEKTDGADENRSSGPAKSRAPRPRRQKSTYVPGRVPKRRKTRFETRLDEVMKAVAMVLPPDQRQQKDRSDDPTFGRNLDLSFSVGTANEHFGFWVGVHSVRMIRGMTGAPAEALVVFSLNDFGVVGPWRPDHEYAGPRRFMSETREALELARECLVENKGVPEDDILVRCNASYSEPTASQLFRFMQDPAFCALGRRAEEKDLTPDEPAPPPSCGETAETGRCDEPTALANSGPAEKDPPAATARGRRRTESSASPAASSVSSTESSVADASSESEERHAAKQIRDCAAPHVERTLPAPVRPSFVRSRHASRSNAAAGAGRPAGRPSHGRSRLAALLGGIG